MGDTAAQDTAYNMKVLKSILSYLRLDSTVRFPFFVRAMITFAANVLLEKGCVTL